MKTLSLDHLLTVLPQARQLQLGETQVEGLTADSRQVKPGTVFVALRGATVDGHDFLDEAISQGAAAVVAETKRPAEGTVTWIQVPDSGVAFGLLASRWEDHPSEDMAVVGITGTNGKTTTAFFLHHILQAAQRRAGLIGTVRIHDGNKASVPTHTTPAAPELQGLLATMRENACHAAVMETSSHGLAQGRCAGVHFSVGVFTNLTQDHLDYHGNVESYFEAKKILFSQMAAQTGGKATAVVNGDDRYGQILAEEFSDKLKVITFGFSRGVDLHAEPPRQQRSGQQFQLSYQDKTYLVRLPFIGRFNVANALAALGAAMTLGVSLRHGVQALAEAPQTPGRMEYVGGEDIGVYVDYAHTPDAVDHACKTVRQLQPKRLLTVFGCGGDRDRTKRPEMGRAAASHSDLLFITSDNPRSENPAAIMQGILPGVAGAKFELIADRRAAIRRAVESAEPGDLILIAGKGHEDYQETNGKRIHFDDREEARNALTIRYHAQRREEEAANPPRERRDFDDRRNFDDRRDRDDRRNPDDRSNSDERRGEEDRR